jgi:hypothetical protein
VSQKAGLLSFLAEQSLGLKDSAPLQLVMHLLSGIQAQFQTKQNSATGLSDHSSPTQLAALIILYFKLLN